METVMKFKDMLVTSDEYLLPAYPFFSLERSSQQITHFFVIFNNSVAA